MEEGWAGYLQNCAFHITDQHAIFRCNAQIIWFLCGSYKCKLILILILFATFQLLRFLVDKMLDTAESAATTRKLVEPFVKKKEEERGRFLEAGEFTPQVALGTKLHRIYFTHPSHCHQCQRKTEASHWLNTTNQINQKYSAFGHSSLSTHLFITKCYSWWKALTKYFIISFLAHWLLWLYLQHFN